MADSVWPEVADKRLLTILHKQVEGSLQLLETCTGDGLNKLAEILDLELGEEVERRILAALLDLQNIDRGMQRLNNVKHCLYCWSESAEALPPAIWRDEMEQFYVMDEEREVLNEELALERQAHG